MARDIRGSQELHLVLMKGFPATGKSLLADRLSHALAWPIIDKDDIKDYTLHASGGNEMAYDIMWSVTARQLHLGLSVIVDSPLTYPISFETGSHLAHAFGANLLVVETRPDEATWRARLDERDPTESAHKISGWADMQALLERYRGCWQYPIPPGHHLIVDSALPVDHVAQRVIERLRLTQPSLSWFDPFALTESGSPK